MLPFVLVFMLLLVNKKELMGEYVNSPSVQRGRLGDHGDHDRACTVAWWWTFRFWKALADEVLLKAVFRQRVAYQRQIGFQEIKLRKLSGSAHCMSLNIRFSISPLILRGLRRTATPPAAVRILVLNARDFVADGGLNSQLFLQFAAQGVARLFAFFDFAAGKLPFQRHGLMAGPLADQELAVLHDQCRYNSLHDWAAVLACSALATGSTQLVKVKAKAATPVETTELELMHSELVVVHQEVHSGRIHSH